MPLKILICKHILNITTYFLYKAIAVVRKGKKVLQVTQICLQVHLTKWHLNY